MLLHIIIHQWAKTSVTFKKYYKTKEGGGLKINAKKQRKYSEELLKNKSSKSSIIVLFVYAKCPV